MIIVDVETTGLDPLRCAILSIGAVDFSDPSRTFYRECRIFSDALVSSEALAINGFTWDHVQRTDLDDLSVVLADFLSWMSTVTDQTLAGENPSFDRDFLRAAFDRCGIRASLGYRTLDLHTLCYAHHLLRRLVPPLKYNRTNISADTCLVYVGLPAEPKPHHALVGAKMEAEAFSRLLLGKGLLAEFAPYPVPQYLLQ